MSTANEVVSEATSTSEQVMAEVESTADKVVIEAASTADEVVAEPASTVDEVVSEAASMAEEAMVDVEFTADKTVVEAESTADKVVAEAASTADEVVAETASTADEVVAEAPSTAAVRTAHGVLRFHIFPMLSFPRGSRAGCRRRDCFAHELMFWLLFFQSDLRSDEQTVLRSCLSFFLRPLVLSSIVLSILRRTGLAGVRCDSLFPRRSLAFSLNHVLFRLPCHF